MAFDEKKYRESWLGGLNDHSAHEIGKHLKGKYGAPPAEGVGHGHGPPGGEQVPVEAPPEGMEMDEADEGPHPDGCMCEPCKMDRKGGGMKHAAPAKPSHKFNLSPEDAMLLSRGRGG